MRVFLCPYDLDLWQQISYNVGMKDKEIKIRADEEFVEKVDYLQRINGHKNRSETIRKTVEKEYRKEKEYTSSGEIITSYPVESGGQIMPIEHPIVAFTHREQCNRCLWQGTPRCVVYGKGMDGELGCPFKARKEKEDGYTY